jgi:hypothetical protein
VPLEKATQRHITIGLRSAPCRALRKPIALNEIKSEIIGAPPSLAAQIQTNVTGIYEKNRLTKVNFWE